MTEAKTDIDYYLGLSKVSLTWINAEQEIEFFVKHLDIPKRCGAALYRDSELAYTAACDAVYRIPFFALNVKGDPLSLKDEYVKAIRSGIAGRVHVTILTDKLEELRTKIRSLKDLISQCDEKLRFNLLRIEMYEEEMSRLAVDNPFKCTSRFSALLSNYVGFGCVTKILLKEARRLSKPIAENETDKVNGDAAEKEPTWEESNNITIEESFDDVLYCWDFVQHWQILYAVCLRCRFGKPGYPTSTATAQAPARSVRGGLRRSMKPGLGEHGFDDFSPRSAQEEYSKPPHHHRPNSALLTRSNSGLMVLVPVVPGNGVGPWEAVCDALDCEDVQPLIGDVDPPETSSLYRAAQRILTMVKSPFLNTIVSKLALSALTAAINDMDPMCDHCSVTADALLLVLADAGEHLEGRLLARLRTSPLWIPMLADLRKSRVKREGGKLVARDDGDVEISPQGKIRTIPFADDYIDSDVLHGSLQRVKVQVAAPRCRVLLKEYTDRRVKLLGERSCTAQMMFALVVPLAQRAMRTAIVRRRYLETRRNLVESAMEAAASTIQCWLIGTVTRRWYRVERAARRIRAAVQIQRIVRGFIAKCRVRKMFRSMADHSKDIAATKLQALMRGVLARRRIAERIAQGAADTLKEAQTWGVVIIQKIARGYIARRTIIKSFHVRNSLSKPVLKLTEKYLKNGNLWSFLHELDMTMRRISDQLKETEEREDHWASTFVRKVVQHRKSEFDGAWNAFHEALSSHHDDGSNTDSFLDFDEDAVMDSNSKDLIISAVGNASGPLLAPVKNLNRITGSPQTKRTAVGPTGSPGHIAVPGVLLRRAITTTVAEGLKQQREAVLKAKSRLTQQQDAILELYSSAPAGMEHPISRKPPKVKKKRVGLTVQPNRGIEKKKGKVSAMSSDWVSKTVEDLSGPRGLLSMPAVARKGGKGKSDQYTRQQLREQRLEDDLSPQQQLSRPVKLGDFLLLDIPLGMADKVDRLLYAASLRCFVPDFFPHHSLQEAYSMYRQLPNGLAKVRYEQCAYSSSQPFVTKLRLKGLSAIADLMPLSKCDMFLRSVGVPLKLLDTAKDIIVILQKHEKISLGLADSATKQRAEQLLSKETVKALVVLPSIEGDSESMEKLEVPDDVDEVEENFGTNFTESFLTMTVSGGAWSNMSAPVDELLLNAAFLICENVERVVEVMKSVKIKPAGPSHRSEKYEQAARALGDGYKGYKKIIPSDCGSNESLECNGSVESDGRIDTLDVFGNDKSITLHGHDSFLQFSLYLEFLASDEKRSVSDIENDQREAIRERYRTALLLSTPFELNLKAEGVNTVSQLSRYDLSRLDLPPLYKTQIEAMLSTAIATAVGAKAADNVNTGNHLPPVNNQIAFKVPLVYNSKFQRGPFDPYGIPPRLEFSTSLSAPASAETMAKKKKFKQHTMKTKFSKSSIDTPSDLPGSIWTTNMITTSNKVESIEIPGSSSMLHHNLSVGRSLDEFIKSIPSPRSVRIRREKSEYDGVFERPYKCSHPYCNEAFSRPYTLRMHEKSHLSMFRDYVKYRNDPQYCYDADKQTRKREDATRLEESAALSSFIQHQIDCLSSGSVSSPS